MSSTLNKQIIEAQMEYATERRKQVDIQNLNLFMEITGDDEYDLGIDSMFWAKVVYGMKH